MSKREFFALTPRLFGKMRRAWLDERREFHRAIAILRTDLINFSIHAPKKRVTLEDLLGAPDKPTAVSQPQRMTKQHRKAVANGLRAMFRGMIAAQPAEDGR